jgi:hypothetical protein
MALHLLAARSRQERQERPPRVEAPVGAEGVSRAGRGAAHERMPDPGRAHAAARQPIGLERQDHGDAIGGLGERADTPFPPCPHLRRDVVEHRHAGAACRARETQVEAGEVDRQEQLHLSAREERADPPLQLPEVREARHDLREPHHGQVVETRDQLHPGGRHARPSDADQLRLRLPAA